MIARVIRRRLAAKVTTALAEAPAVALLGPRQAGKTTMAHVLARKQPSVYLDLESAADRAKLTDPELYLRQHQDKLVVLDEVQRVPELFVHLRSLIDAGRREGRRSGRFLIPGSASLDLLQQSAESLAGRIRYLELAPFDAGEVAADCLRTLWLRGGFPESFLAGIRGRRELRTINSLRPLIPTRNSPHGHQVPPTARYVQVRLPVLTEPGWAS